MGIEIAEVRADGDVGILVVEERVLLVVGKDVVELDLELVARFGVETEECVSAGREDVHVFERDVFVDGQAVAGERGVVRREDQRIGHVADADVAIDDLMDQAAAAAVGLDADAVVGAVDGEVVDEQVIDAAEGAAADGHAVAGIEMVVQDGHVGDGARAAGLEADIVVAGVNVAVGDGDIARRAGIDAVGVARGFGRHDLHAPRGEAVGLIDGDVEAGRVAQGDVVHREVVDVAQGDHGEDALLTGL